MTSSSRGSAHVNFSDAEVLHGQDRQMGVQIFEVKNYYKESESVQHNRLMPWQPSVPGYYLSQGKPAR